MPGERKRSIDGRDDLAEGVDLDDVASFLEQWAVGRFGDQYSQY